MTCWPLCLRAGEQDLLDEPPEKEVTLDLWTNYLVSCRFDSCSRHHLFSYADHLFLRSHFHIDRRWRQRGERHPHLSRCQWIVEKLPDRGSGFARSVEARSRVGLGVLFNAQKGGGFREAESGTHGARAPRDGVRRTLFSMYPECGRSSRASWFHRCRAHARRTVQKPM